METETQTIADFLLARIADDGETARRVGVSEPIVWGLQAGLDHHEGVGSGWVEVDPGRVLAECEAKRRIVELHSQDEHDCVEMHRGAYPADWPVEAAWGKAGEPWAHPSLEHQVGPCPTLLALAQPFADRAGFRQEWRVG